jgi:hypothetical protein
MLPAKSTTKKTTENTTRTSSGEYHEDFLRLANEANIHTAESGTGENWEVWDKDTAKKAAQDEEDKVEWVMVGKTPAEKKKKKRG